VLSIIDINMYGILEYGSVSVLMRNQVRTLSMCGLLY